MASRESSAIIERVAALERELASVVLQKGDVTALCGVMLQYGVLCIVCCNKETYPRYVRRLA
jgi:hypothetical protein